MKIFKLAREGDDFAADDSGSLRVKHKKFRDISHYVFRWSDFGTYERVLFSNNLTQEDVNVQLADAYENSFFLPTRLHDLRNSLKFVIRFQRVNFTATIR